MKRALISVYDKRNIVAFAKNLVRLGWEIISTGGTYKVLKEAEIAVKEVSELTQFPECFDGRVKTLHPLIHGGILYRRDDKTHEAQREMLEIPPIDMVVNNLYPFKTYLLDSEKTHEEKMENIDIGGPSMIRAAAKNYAHVIVLTDPQDYEGVLEKLQTKGELSLADREYLAAKAFSLTAHYDGLISGYFNQKNKIKFPKYLTLTFETPKVLRYGENPHQEGGLYQDIFAGDHTLVGAVQLQGKELSYNNYNDTQGALTLIREFNEKPAVVASKHGNPCGVSQAETIEIAFHHAYEADPVSIYGGVVALNQKVTAQAAAQMKNIFLEVLIAPDYEEEALNILSAKKNLRVLKSPSMMEEKPMGPSFKYVDGGILIQDQDLSLIEELKTVTERKPTKEEIENLLFAWKVVKHAKSNGIVVAKNHTTTGIGPGQVSRIWALENAIRQSKDTKGAVMASDAFLPFDDCVKAAHKAGITAIIQPGGSVRDEESIKACNQYHIAMIFTGMRHFKH